MCRNLSLILNIEVKESLREVQNEMKNRWGKIRYNMGKML